MQAGGPLDFLPLWGVFLATVAVILLSIEGGFRLGTYRRRRSRGRISRPSARWWPPPSPCWRSSSRSRSAWPAPGSTCGGGWSSTRPTRSGRPTSARGCSPSPTGRTSGTFSGSTWTSGWRPPSRASSVESVRRSEELHARLWAHATAVAEKQPNSVVVGLFIWSLNEVIDLHAKRLALGPRTRLPGTIWATLYLVAVLGMECDRIPRRAGRLGQVAGDPRAGPRVLGGPDADRRHRPPPGGAPPHEPAALAGPSKKSELPGGERLRPAHVAPGRWPGVEAPHPRRVILQERSSLPFPSPMNLRVVSTGAAGGSAGRDAKSARPVRRHRR